MTIKILTALFLAAALFVPPARAQTNSDPALDAIFKQVNDNFVAGKTTEADFKPILNQLDALAVARQKDPSTDAVPKIIFLKAHIYFEALHDLQAGTDLLEKIKATYPASQYAKLAEANLQDIDEQMKAAAQLEKLPPSLADGQPFPDFTEKDLSGKPVSPSALKGKVVLLDFWATWCPPCLAELPNITALYKEQHKNGFEIISISADDDRGNLESFLKKHPDMTWPQYFDGKGMNNELVTKYEIPSFPCTILIGKDGKIIGSFLSGKKLAAAVTDALAAK